MKHHIKKWAARSLAALSIAALCGTARADLSVSNSATLASWNTVGGQNPFYTSLTSANLTGLTAAGQPGANGGATYTVLSETFTITNGAGSLNAVTGNTNYSLTGFAILAGGGAGLCSVHLYDITTNLTSNNGTILNGSGASYGFTANGDLLGNGNGLSFSNALPGERQVYFTFSAGPNTQDQIVLGTNRTYALEVWTPVSISTAFTWYKNAIADAGGQGMGGRDSRLNTNRISLANLGLVGGAPRTFALALYGSATNAALTINGSTNAVPETNYIVDYFNSPGYGLTNSYVGTNNYANGDITNVWDNWFGGAWLSNSWDATSDAQSNPQSGAIKITRNFSLGDQDMVRDFNNGISPSLDGTRITRFECDVRYAAGSALSTNGGVGIFGRLEFGTRGGDFGQHFFGAVEVPAANTNWIHVSIPINAAANTNFVTIPNLLIHTYGPYYSPALSGLSTLWVDNIKFVGPTTVTAPVPPTLSIEKANPALRIFAGDTVTYNRAGIATMDQNASWVGGTFPVSYSFTLKNLPSVGGFQFHMFLIPIGSLPGSYGGNPYGNSFADFDALNNLWLRIQGGSAQVAWKTNLTSANPNNVVATITPSTLVGTWKLTFTSSTAGTLTGPDGTFANFTLPANVPAQFANPLVAYFGLQPNSSGGVGQYVDLAQITITNTAGASINDIFALDSAFDAATWTNVSATKPNVAHVSTNNPYWVKWTVPDLNFGLATKADLTDTITPWYRPDYWNGYFNYPTVRLIGGTTKWILIGNDNLPTVDGNPNSTPAANAFFHLSNPPPPN